MSTLRRFSDYDAQALAVAADAEASARRRGLPFVDAASLATAILRSDGPEADLMRAHGISAAHLESLPPEPHVSPGMTDGLRAAFAAAEAEATKHARSRVTLRDLLVGLASTDTPVAALFEDDLKDAILGGSG
jgi:hypothetical protein